MSCIAAFFSHKMTNRLQTPWGNASSFLCPLFFSPPIFYGLYICIFLNLLLWSLRGISVHVPSVFDIVAHMSLHGRETWTVRWKTLEMYHCLILNAFAHRHHHHLLYDWLSCGDLVLTADTTEILPHLYIHTHTQGASKKNLSPLIMIAHVLV